MIYIASSPLDTGFGEDLEFLGLRLVKEVRNVMTVVEVSEQEQPSRATDAREDLEIDSRDTNSEHT